MCTTLFELYQAILADLSSQSDILDCLESLPTEPFAPLLEQISVKADCHPDKFARATSVALLLRGLGKHYTGEDFSLPTSERERGALEKFRAANEHCAKVNDLLRRRRSGPLGTDLFDSATDVVFGEARRFIASTLWWVDDDGWGRDDVPLLDVAASLAVGPGSSLGAEGTSFLHKVVGSELTCTSEALYRMYASFVNHAPCMFDEDGNVRSTPSPISTWSLTEKIRKQIHGNRLVKASRLAYVPKSWKISRTVCTEPSVNMMFQLALGNTVVSFLRSAGLNLETQQVKNGRLARRGSEDGSLVTLDLSSASDTVSIELCRTLLPSDWFNWLMLTRSPAVSIDGTDMELEMISSMGNGYTFPLESLIFLSLVYGVYRYLDIPFKLRVPTDMQNVAVYGDDIIVVPEAVSLLCLVLNESGFVVNRDKSCLSGSFRESCGAFYYAGYDCRPVKVISLSTPQDRYSVLNRLLRWISRNEFSHLRRTSRLLLRGTARIYVPPYEGDKAGIHVPIRHACTRRAGKTLSDKLGCDPRTHVYERFEPVRKMFQVFRFVKTETGEWIQSQAYQALNPEGLFLSILHGCVSGAGVTLRSNGDTRYEKRWAVATGWCIPSGGLLRASHTSDSDGGRGSYSSWERAVTETLG